MKMGALSAASSMAKHCSKRERQAQKLLDIRAMQWAQVAVTKLSLSAKQDNRKLKAVSVATLERIVREEKALEEFKQRAKEYQRSVVQLKLQKEIIGMVNQQKALAKIMKYIEQRALNLERSTVNHIIMALDSVKEEDEV